MAAIHKFITRLIIFALRVYRYAVSPLLGACCRFEPSCSVYAMESMKRYGWFYGSGLTIKRLCRCHPWCEGGVDPVP